MSREYQMLTHWNNLLNRDCEVVKIKDLYVYPIFKNGSTELLAQKDKLIINNDIKNLKSIVVILREPTERFISGVNKVAFENSRPVAETMSKIKNNKLIDLHFAPQFIWLLHLKKYFDGDIQFAPMYTLDRLLPKKSKDWKDYKKIKVEPIKKFIEVDEKLIKKYLHKTPRLETVIRDLINVLPKN